MENRNYRRDIDGLRAIAVIGVLLFHLDIQLFSGGFTGVDVFFVISGFLITGLIRQELLTRGNFDFKAFYVRRFRRLAPALFATLCVTLFVAILLFSPEQLTPVGSTALAALFGISNFHFWLDSGYFDAASTSKPLLHTWSLAVEEQFYLFWPLLLVLLTRSKKVFASGLFLLIVFSLGLGFNHVFFSSGATGIALPGSLANNSSSPYYLLPFRMYEFVVGAALVFFPIRTLNKILADFVLAVGLTLILVTFVLFDQSTPFPSYNALLPCIGTALVIIGGEHARYLKVLVANPVFVFIGLISYSLYLVHWPLIVFWRYVTFEPLAQFDVVAILFISIVLAWGSYKFIEQPFRARNSAIYENKKVVLGTSLLCVSVFLSIAIAIWRQDGWQWRVSTDTAASMFNPPVVQKLPRNDLKRGKFTDAFEIGNQSNAVKKVLVIGDSHAQQLEGMAQYLSSKYNLHFTFNVHHGCPPIFGTYKIYNSVRQKPLQKKKQEACRKQIRQWEKFVKRNQFDFVMLASRWNWMFEPTKYYDTKQRRDLLVSRDNPDATLKASRKIFPVFLKSTIETIQSKGAKVIVLGQVPHAGIELKGCNDMPTWLIPESKISRRCNHVPREHILKRNAFSSGVIKRVARNTGAYSVLPSDFFCAKEKEFCDFVVQGVRLKNDDDHVNKYGAVYIAREWEKLSSFPFKP